MTKVTGWDNGLSQDYDKGLGRWFANRLGARQQLRQDFEMTQVLIDRATLEQLVGALEYWAVRDPYNKETASALTAGRAALAGSERVEPVPTRIERKVYKGSAEYPEYLSARFTKDKQAGSFEWQGHRWAYHWTSFDDAGDFDLIYRNTPPKETP